jgi:hypothetical protein
MQAPVAVSWRLRYDPNVAEQWRSAFAEHPGELMALFAALIELAQADVSIDDLQANVRLVYDRNDDVFRLCQHRTAGKVGVWSLYR